MWYMQSRSMQIFDAMIWEDDGVHNSSAYAESEVSFN